MDINKDIILNSKKIAIFGWPATGKSTFAEKLSNITNIPLYYLDTLRFKNFSDGKKDEEYFLVEYDKILKKDKWIMEGNALDFISSRLEQSDILIFFESTTEKSINNVIARDKKIKDNIEMRKGFQDFETPVEDTINWIKNRYSKKIDKLRITLKNYNNKLIVINNYAELDMLLELLIK